MFGLHKQTSKSESSSEFKIRKAKLSDTKAIRTMHAQSWIDTYPDEEFGVSEKWVKERVAQWLTPEGLKQSEEHFRNIFDNPNNFYRIATVNDNVVGLVHASNVGGKQKLEALYVDKGQKGSGLAQELMAEADDWFDEDEAVELEVASYNQRAIRFYSSHGFKIVPNSHHVYADKIPSVTMVRAGGRWI